MRLKRDVMARWIETEWIPSRQEQDLMTVAAYDVVVNQRALEKFDEQIELPEGYHFAGTEATECPVTVTISEHGRSGRLTARVGAFQYRFTRDEGDTVEVLVTAGYVSDHGHKTCLACVPKAFLRMWAAFVDECEQLARGKATVMVIGGQIGSFIPKVNWEDIILPSDLKDDLMQDVESFYDKGVAIYQRLNLKPFRKLLLAGVPGTGKTMLCTALAKWSLERGHKVIYISSADIGGAHFSKIQQALHVAAHSNAPTLILLEELDAYLHQKQDKALVLNVLDGSEAIENDQGTLLVATTNYPEAIDDRILKRPGRLDRIYIIPEVRQREDAEKMLRRYLGEMWREEHGALASELVGYPGAFIREVVVYALTQVAYGDGMQLPLEVLERSYERLREQIDARDDFLMRKTSMASILWKGKNN